MTNKDKYVYEFNRLYEDVKSLMPKKTRDEWDEMDPVDRLEAVLSAKTALKGSSPTRGLSRMTPEQREDIVFQYNENIESLNSMINYLKSILKDSDEERPYAGPV